MRSPHPSAFWKRVLLLTGLNGAMIAASAAEVRIAPDLPVTVRSGVVAGVAGRDATITVFKGIPYAAPPVGALRWRPPQPPVAWKGTRQADTYCASCMQELRRSFLPWTEEFMLRNDVSEDCLALNIWTPARRADAKLPVYVFIHGGAYFSGSGEVLLYDGEALARKGVVVVTINYRLGVFGFLAHPELTAESPEHTSGNYALLDQIAALHWVQENIAAFGGDPGRVTIGGQSAGAGSVHFLTVSPLARGLFQRAIAQSGPWRPGTTTPTLTDGERKGTEFAQAIGAPSLAELRALSAEELYARYQAHEFRFQPIVDGWVVPDQVPAIVARGQSIDVPLLTGWTADERSSRAGYGETTLADFRAAAQKRFGDRADAFFALYPATTDAGAVAAQRQSWRDEDLAALHWWTALRAQHGNARDHGYFFTRAIPWPEHPEYQAFHSADLPYTFDNLALMNRPWDDVDRRLADLMSDYWVNFIAQGDPNRAGLPAWPADNDQVMRFGTDSHAVEILAPKKLQFFERVFAKETAASRPQ